MSGPPSGRWYVDVGGGDSRVFLALSPEHHALFTSCASKHGIAVLLSTLVTEALDATMLRAAITDGAPELDLEAARALLNGTAFSHEVLTEAAVAIGVLKAQVQREET